MQNEYVVRYNLQFVTHTCTCSSVGPSSVTFSFPINYSIMLRPTCLKLGPHIHPG